MIWLLMTAHAASPEWTLGAAARLQAEREGVAAYGPELSAGWALRPWVQAEAFATWEPGAAAVGPRLRLHRDALSLSFGAGLDTDLRALSEAGVALDLPMVERLGLRVATVYRAQAHAHSGGLVFSLRRPAAPPAPVEVTPVEVAPVEVAPVQVAPLETPPPTPPVAPVIHPPDAWIWLPHPDCIWIPADSPTALLDHTQPGDEVWVEAPAYIPQAVEIHDPLVIELQPAPDRGALIISATPLDRVQVDQQAVQLDADGIAIIAAPEGNVRVEVVGGGRAWSQQVAVANGYALWLQSPPPTQHDVSFAVSSAVVQPKALARIQDVADSLGGWSLEVYGSYSAEGALTVNLALARARAQAVIDALIAAGVPTDHVHMAAPHPPDPSLSAEAQRSAHIIARGAP